MEQHQPEIHLELELGYKIGKLTFERAGYFKPTDHAKKERYLYLFKCECGNSILLPEEEIGEITHCGCERYSSIKSSEINEKIRSIYYRTVSSCNNPKEKTFSKNGMNGVRIYTKWKFDYGAFQKWALENGYEDGYILDRKDRNGDFVPNNCIWVNLHEFLKGRRPDADRDKLNQVEEFKKTLKVGNKIGVCTILDFDEVHITLQCECGITFIKPIREIVSAKYSVCRHNRNPGMEGTKGGYIHGMTDTRLFNIWDTFKGRCYRKTHKSYARYGGRGIRVCDEWKDDFMNFYNWAMNNGYKDDLTIDRIDVNKDYCPENCRWISPRDQQNNRRNTIYVRGKPLADVCRELGLPRNAIYRRISDGWDPETALTTPLKTLKPYAAYGSKKK